MSHIRKSYKLGICFLVLISVVVCLSISCGGESDLWREWRVEQEGNYLMVAYGSGMDFPQYAVIDLASSFMRMNYGYGSAWGTSILLMPSFWEQGILYQGREVTSDWQTDGDDMIVYVNGIIGNLSVCIVIRFYPPSEELFSAQVEVTVEGDARLDNKPGEAFKLVTLSSMRTATDYWDSRIAYAGDTQTEIPEEGWFFNPSVIQRKFGLLGGSTAWKEKAPTVEVLLDREVHVTGWVTYSIDPNDDNVGFWGATEYVVNSYTYTVTAKP